MDVAKRQSIMSNPAMSADNRSSVVTADSIKGYTVVPLHSGITNLASSERNSLGHAADSTARPHSQVVKSKALQAKLYQKESQQKLIARYDSYRTSAYQAGVSKLTVRNSEIPPATPSTDGHNAFDLANDEDLTMNARLEARAQLEGLPVSNISSNLSSSQSTKRKRRQACVNGDFPQVAVSSKGKPLPASASSDGPAYIAYSIPRKPVGSMPKVEAEGAATGQTASRPHQALRYSAAHPDGLAIDPVGVAGGRFPNTQPTYPLGGVFAGAGSRGAVSEGESNFSTITVPGSIPAPLRINKPPVAREPSICDSPLCQCPNCGNRHPPNLNKPLPATPVPSITVSEPAPRLSIMIPSPRFSINFESPEVAAGRIENSKSACVDAEEVPICISPLDLPEGHPAHPFSPISSRAPQLDTARRPEPSFPPPSLGTATKQAPLQQEEEDEEGYEAYFPSFARTPPALKDNRRRAVAMMAASGEGMQILGRRGGRALTNLT
ncbi:MAG: hypothetical protein M1820_008826 [Bogoriella megaspora]|nr:MAG: hypothetical protein M1820_008826 [Bogoriella megaspora]